MKPICIILLLIPVLFSADEACRQVNLGKLPSGQNKKRKDTLNYMDLADSSQLMHLANQFYKNKSKHIFERTIADVDIDGVDTLTPVEYFNGAIPQDLDPYSFTELDGWFAVDKKFAYYYRPTSGGMLIEKLTGADAKTFEVLAGDYRYAKDKFQVYAESEIIDNLNAKNLQTERNSQGNIIRLISGNVVYSVTPVK